MNRIRCLLVAAAVFFLISSAACATPPPHSGFRLIGYVAGAEKFPAIAAEKLSALNFAFAHIDPSGRVTLDQAGAAEFLAKLRALKSRNPRLQILVSVG